MKPKQIRNESANRHQFNRINRREALKRTVVFSTGLLTASWFNSSLAKAPETNFSGDGLDFLAMGDFGTGNEHQRAVARQMATFAKKLNRPLTAVLALGDNFYGKLAPERFGPHFEQMYRKEDFDCPFYAILGNHDYGPKYDSGQGPAKAKLQLDYAKNNPTSRWKMPAKWYSVELPDAKNPLVKIILLDGNSFLGALTPKEKLAQKRWLDAELKKKTDAPWKWMITHYPVFSETSKRGDNAKLIESLGGHLKANQFSLYLSGHDHNLQHIEANGYDTSFIVSGAGGQKLYEVTPSKRGYSQMILGFNHIHVTRDKVTVQFIDTEGRCMHEFQRSLNGKVETVKI
jgi:hypothetical protein